MSSVSALSGFGQDQLLQLLVSQLQNQDPLDPVSNKDLIDQVTSLNTLSGIQSLNASFAESLKIQQLSQGTNLVGRTVEYNTPGSTTSSTGVVSSVTAQDGKFVLLVQNDRVGLDQIVSVR